MNHEEWNRAAYQRRKGKRPATALAAMPDLPDEPTEQARLMEAELEKRRDADRARALKAARLKRRKADVLRFQGVTVK